MSALDTLVSEFFGMPGGGDPTSDALLRRAAWAHGTLLVRAAVDAKHPATNAGPPLAAIAALLQKDPCRGVCNRFLLDPTFVEGLHAAANDSSTLADWHRNIADPSVARVWTCPTTESAAQLGNSLLPLLLRDDPHWQGTIRLRTDLFGRLRFPLSDWSICLWSKHDGRDAVLSQKTVLGTVGRDEVRLSLGDKLGDELLVMPRAEWQRMVVDNCAPLHAHRISWPRGAIGLRLQGATAIPGWHVRYDPVSMHQFERHAAVTGGLVATILEAIAGRSPGIAGEFGTLIAAVRGWELPSGDYGTLQSFSDPTAPRVMGINVTYSDDDEPQACPYCFTWFGHELGHTKSYLIETILYVLGYSLMSRHGEFTETIARYGRALPLRTLLQIPYTHLYEWMLMMDFIEGDPATLPWELGEDPPGCADDLQAEIYEAFDCIEREASLSDAGQAVVAHMHTLCGEAEQRWQRLRGRADCSPIARPAGRSGRIPSLRQPLLWPP